MSVESPRIRSLLRQADSVAAAGKRAAAEQLYRQIIDEAPETAGAWHGLAQVVRDPEERDEALSRAQELDPGGKGPDERTSDTSDVPVRELTDETDHQQATTYSADGQAKKKRDVVAVDSEKHTETVDDATYPATDEPADRRKREQRSETEQLYCANHPGRKTHLRCNRCGKPICSTCANPTPVGYRCPECIKEQEDVYFTATLLDYLVTFLVAFPLSLAIGWVATLILSSAFGFFLIFLGAFTGTLIGRISFRAARRRRGRWLPHLVVVCVVIGGVLPALGFLVAALSGQFSLRLIFLGIYLVAAAGATYYQMR